MAEKCSKCLIVDVVSLHHKPPAMPNRMEQVSSKVALMTSHMQSRAFVGESHGDLHTSAGDTAKAVWQEHLSGS